jgi:hypothetical protein
VSDEQFATFRIFIAGQLVDQTTISGLGDDIGGLAVRHGELCEAANRAGRKYLVEVEFGDGEHVRWGTDVDGMVIPMEVGIDDLMRALMKRYGR